MPKPTVITSFDVAYGGTCYIYIAEAECKNCGTIGLCLGINVSKSEYGSGCICRKCIDDSFTFLGEEGQRKYLVHQRLEKINEPAGPTLSSRDQNFPIDARTDEEARVAAHRSTGESG